MTRLSVNIREQMARALVRHAFNKEGQRLLSVSADLFRRVYAEHYPADVQKHMKAIQRTAGKSSFATMTSVRVNAAGPMIEVGAVSIGYDPKWKLDKPEVLPHLYDISDYRANISLPLDHPLIAEVIQFGNDAAAFKKDTETAYNEALGTLGQFNSAKQLEQTWPDALPIIGALIPEGNRALPVVQVETLNKKFKLPPKGA